ncbi:MAG: hypothetical protein FWD71_22865, partial [Oscillospiraceae bacterium]|nr:hypothetical protein [Oscillospiraceae bacterium]
MFISKRLVYKTCIAVIAINILFTACGNDKMPSEITSTAITLTPTAAPSQTAVQAPTAETSQTAAQTSTATPTLNTPAQNSTTSDIQVSSPVIETTPTPEKEADPNRYILYQNYTFGFTIEYPDTFRESVIPDNSDSRMFTSADGRAALTVSGAINNINADVDTEYSTLSEQIGSIAYGHKGTDWFVATWFNGDDIYYVKEFVDSGGISRMLITYPQTQEA